MSRVDDAMARYRDRNLGSDRQVLALTVCMLLVAGASLALR